MSDQDDLHATTMQFCNFVKRLPSGALAEQDWGPKEVLAHLVYHHELYVRLVEGIVKGKPVPPPEGRFRELNARAVLESRGISVEQLVKRLEQADKRLVRLYGGCDPDAVVIRIKADAKPRTFSQLVPEVKAHIRTHLRNLRREMRLAMSNE